MDYLDLKKGLSSFTYCCALLSARAGVLVLLGRNESLAYQYATETFLFFAGTLFFMLVLNLFDKTETIVDGDVFRRLGFVELTSSTKLLFCLVGFPIVLFLDEETFKMRVWFPYMVVLGTACALVVLGSILSGVFDLSKNKEKKE